MTNNFKYRLVLVAIIATSLIQRLLYRISLERFPPFCSALALIENNNKYLVVYHSVYKQYSFPGGYIRLHENPANAVQRELKEETGLTIHPEWIVGAYENKRGVKSVNIIYKCTANITELVCNYEGKCEWLPEEIFSEKLIDHCKEALNDYKKRKASLDNSPV